LLRRSLSLCAVVDVIVVHPQTCVAVVEKARGRDITTRIQSARHRLVVCAAVLPTAAMLILGMAQKMAKVPRTAAAAAAAA